MAQKRSENTYQKINTIFKRDENNIIMPDAEFSVPELNWLRNCKFDATEKIDGTNIRIEVVPTLNVMSYRNEPFMFVVRYKGKTDNAQIPGLFSFILKRLIQRKRYLKLLDFQSIFLRSTVRKRDTNILKIFQCTQSMVKAMV